MENGASPEVVAKEAEAALADLAGRDLTGLTDAEIEAHAIATAELLRLAEAAHVAALARLDSAGAWAPSGARSAAHYIAWKGHLPLPRAKALQRCGRRLRDLPVAAEAFAAGLLTVEHVRLLAHAHSKAPDAFAADEPRLVELAAPSCSPSSRRSSATGSITTIPTAPRSTPPPPSPRGGWTARRPSRAPSCSMRCSTR